MKKYLYDYKRYSFKVPYYEKKLLKWYRNSQEKNGIIKFFCKLMLQLYRKKRNIEISEKNQIGEGLYLGHTYNITISQDAIIGKNCNIHKGVTIGRENRGSRKGAPIIGDCVYIGINATIVGKVCVGNNVLIASNSFVNCDIPDNSIVIGNPCRIINSENATEGYINNKV